MMTTKISRSAQAISGGTLLTIAVATGITGLAINVAHGWQVSLAAATLFGLADATKIALPLVCGVIGWTRQTRITAAVCVAVSLWCACNAYIDGAGQNLAGKQHGAEQYAAAKAQVAQLESRVADLDAQARQEAARGGCGKQCKYLGTQSDKARQELAMAREALKAAAPVAVSPYASLKANVTAGLYLFLIEALIWLSVPAMACLAAARRKPEAKATPRKSRKVARPKRRTDAQVAKLKQIAEAPKLTKSGKLDQRTKAARAVKRVTSRQLLTA